MDFNIPAMNKEEHLANAYKEIQISSGTTVTNIEQRLISLGKSYLRTKNLIDKIFYEKIEELRKFKQ